MGLLKNNNSLPPNVDTTHRAKSKTERYLLQKRQHQQVVYQSLKYLLIIICITALIDTFYFAQYTLTRSLALGAGLNWLSHAIFTKFVFRYSSAQAHRQIVYQMYIGQMIKWSFTLLGFALIFNYVRPIHTFAVLIGYILMVMAQGIVLLRLK